MFRFLHLICLKVIIFLFIFGIYIHLFPIVCLFNCFELPNMYENKLELRQFNFINLKILGER